MMYSIIKINNSYTRAPQLYAYNISLTLNLNSVKENQIKGSQGKNPLSSTAFVRIFAGN